MFSSDQAECDLRGTQTTHICMKAKRLKGVSSLYKHLPEGPPPENPCISNIRKYNIMFQSSRIDFLLAFVVYIDTTFDPGISKGPGLDVECVFPFHNQI